MVEETQSLSLAIVPHKENVMNWLWFAASAFVITASAAFAQSPVPANQTYCLEVRDGGGRHPPLCRFTTMAQCIASKTGQSDYCTLNPEIAFRRR